MHPTNAVTDDHDLLKALAGIHTHFSTLVERFAGELWGMPLIDQKTKAFITIALDVANGTLSGPGAPFEAHIDMALKQGATAAEIEELLLFLCGYAGLNKAAAGLGRFNEIKTKGQTALGTACR